MKICILTIATNKYIQFVERLLNNIEENFLNGHEIQCLLFTDHEIEESSDNVKISQIEHEDWPMPTLKRYNYFMKEKEFISQFDYCFYFDVDMGIVDKVGDEVLSDLVATQHPYQSFHPPAQQSFCRDERSLHMFLLIKKRLLTTLVDLMVDPQKSFLKCQKFLLIGSPKILKRRHRNLAR